MGKVTTTDYVDVNVDQGFRLGCNSQLTDNLLTPTTTCISVYTVNNGENAFISIGGFLGVVQAPTEFRLLDVLQEV